MNPMSTALVDHPPIEATANVAPAAGTISSRSRILAFTATLVSAIVVMWVAVATMTMVMADTTLVGAIGVDAFAAFWLGGGFGAIFGSAAAFGRDH